MGSLDRSSGNEGEGSRSGDKQYREGVEQFLKKNDPEQLAKDAQRDVAGSPAEYEAAEAAGRSRSAGEDPEGAAGDVRKDQVGQGEEPTSGARGNRPIERG
jgi:hypothetical protein